VRITAKVLFGSVSAISSLNAERCRKRAQWSSTSTSKKKKKSCVHVVVAVIVVSAGLLQFLVHVTFVTSTSQLQIKMTQQTPSQLSGELMIDHTFNVRKIRHIFLSFISFVNVLFSNLV
jgi:hypothetical protein